MIHSRPATNCLVDQWTVDFHGCFFNVEGRYNFQGPSFYVTFRRCKCVFLVYVKATIQRIGTNGIVDEIIFLLKQWSLNETNNSIWTPRVLVRVYFINNSRDLLVVRLTYMVQKRIWESKPRNQQAVNPQQTAGSPTHLP